jgi:hypothetical protein
VVARVSLKRKYVEIKLREHGQKPSRLANPGSHVHNILPAKKHKLKFMNYTKYVLAECALGQQQTSYFEHCAKVQASHGVKFRVVS